MTIQTRNFDTSLNVEVAVSVYSVVIVPAHTHKGNADLAIHVVAPYLYGHTTEVENGVYLLLANEAAAIVLKTTASHLGLAGTFHNDTPVLSALRLAQGQVDRLASGLYGGQVVGVEDEARAFAAEIVTD